jgi:tetratricopeptide (TPR) repeat protein
MSSSLRTCLLVVSVIVAVAASSDVAEAQRADLSPTEIEEARALFVAGSAAIENGRWSDAVSSFERAYAITHAPSALFNRAFSLRALGRHREARDDFARLLADHELEASMRSDAERYLREERARVAVIELAGLADVPHALRLDGRDVTDPGDRPITIDTDAGEHAITAEREGYEPFRWEGTLSDGERRRLDVVLQPLALALGPEAPRGDDTAVHVVIVIAVLVALAAGGGVLGWYLQESAQVQPRYMRQVMP